MRPGGMVERWNSVHCTIAIPQDMPCLSQNTASPPANCYRIATDRLEGGGGERSVSPRCSLLCSTHRNSPRKTGDANSALSPPLLSHSPIFFVLARNTITTALSPSRKRSVTTFDLTLANLIVGVPTSV